MFGFDFGNLKQRFEQRMEGGFVAKRDTLEDSLYATLFALLDTWIENGQQGADKLSVELDHLLRNLQNKSDPLVKKISVMNQMMIFAVLNTLTKAKGDYHAKRKASSEAQQSFEGFESAGGTNGQASNVSSG